MDDSKIIKNEIANQCTDHTNSDVSCDESHLLPALEESDDSVVVDVNDTIDDRDLHTVQNKRLELDNIQKDLDDLMGRLNNFIADSQDSFIDDIDGASETEGDTGSISEKQDGPQEKELNLYATGANLLNKIYSTDHSNPPEINWEAVGPILQKHVSDLQRLHNLNEMTNAVVRRIRNVTQINEALLKQADEQLEESS